MADSKSSGTDTVVKVVLIFFISLLSFSIGTFVGKKFSDNQHKMAILEPHSNAKGDVGHEEDANEHHDTQNAEASHETKENEKGVKAKHNSDEEELTEEQVSTLEDEMVDETDLKPGYDSAKNENSPKLTRMLASEMAQRGAGKYTVQVAAFSSQEEAEKKVKELKALKLESFSTETTVKGHQWYRVNVGLFATIKEAQTQKSQLADQAKITSAIIQKVSK
jgi:cell division septation protein DedD